MSYMQEPLISVVLPVYNRIEYLGQAIDSVLTQTYKNWELIIADDASDENTKEFLAQYNEISNIRIYSNPKNLGLFTNLNQAIRQSKGECLLLLCSDDLLLPECLQNSLSFLRNNSQVEIVLSAFKVIDLNGEELPSASIFYYNQIISQTSQLLNSNEVLPLLLQHGSINGNLSGMFFTRKLYEKVGGFREDSVQIADWEWVYRVAKITPIFMSKIPVAVIRSHQKQLSAVNFKNLRNSLEVIEMVSILLKDPILVELDAAPRWALHIMQLHLWYALKFALKGYLKEAFTLAQAINQVTGFGKTLWAMLRWLPQRWQIFRQKGFSLPPL
jgi:glycosyltransferase involved in cell wall biosynthesis